MAALGKQILKFRILTKRRVYLGLGVLLLAWFGFRTFAELSHPGLSLFDAYAMGGLVFAGLLLFIGWRIPKDE